MKQVERGHWTPRAKEFFYAQRASSLGVRNRGKTWDSRTQENNVVNTTIIPSQQDHAGSLGVHRDTIARWEEDRKEIMSDPELAEKATTLEGYKEAKKLRRSLGTDVKQSREKACYTPSHLSGSRTTSY